MIDFACKQFKIEEVVKCALGLRTAEFKVLMHFSSHPDEAMSAERVAKSSNLNITTVQRAVKKLYEKQILIRKQENLQGGGYLFLYTLSDSKIVRKSVIRIIGNWRSNVDKALRQW